MKWQSVKLLENLSTSVRFQQCLIRVVSRRPGMQSIKWSVSGPTVVYPGPGDHFDPRRPLLWIPRSAAPLPKAWDFGCGSGHPQPPSLGLFARGHRVDQALGILGMLMFKPQKFNAWRVKAVPACQNNNEYIYIYVSLSPSLSLPLYIS